MSSGWTITKDAVGFVGALLATVPWFRDFYGRMRVARIEGLPVGDSLRSLQAELQLSVETWIAAPKVSDLLWVLGGLVLVAVSFLIGLIQSLAA